MKKLFLLAALATAMLATPAHAVIPSPPPPNKSVSTSLSAAGACSTTGVGAYIKTDSISTVSAVITGTFVGTITFKAAADDKVSFNVVNAFPQAGGAPVTTATGTGTWFIPAGGYRYVCAYFSAYTSGTAVVRFEGSTAAPAVPSGANLSAPGGTAFNCNVAVSTATTLTAVGGSCVAPGAGLSLYITDIDFGSSAASTTAADSFPTLKYGTGGTCGTATAVFWSALSAANTTVTANLTTPIKIPANNEICFIHSVAGSKTVRIGGFIAP